VEAPERKKAIPKETVKPFPLATWPIWLGGRPKYAPASGWNNAPALQCIRFSNTLPETSTQASIPNLAFREEGGNLE
jgi:hypothetical protein